MQQVHKHIYNMKETDWHVVLFYTIVLIVAAFVAFLILIDLVHLSEWRRYLFIFCCGVCLFSACVICGELL